MDPGVVYRIQSILWQFPPSSAKQHMHFPDDKRIQSDIESFSII